MGISEATQRKQEKRTNTKRRKRREAKEGIPGSRSRIKVREDSRCVRARAKN